MKKIFFVLIFISLGLFTTAQTKPTIEWLNIPSGTFTMGSPATDFRRNKDETQHKVTLSAFRMSKYEITFEQYDMFCQATGREKPNDADWGRDKMPVINVDWNDASAFADWVGCRLPTEAEWEYACRAGTITTFNNGNNDNLTTSQANYDGNYPYWENTVGEYKYRGRSLPVGSFPPNKWGLYDMHGNLWEWCNDWYGIYPKDDQINPKGPETGSSRVLRGGSWDSDAFRCCSANRGDRLEKGNPLNRGNDIGFRIVTSK